MSWGLFWTIALAITIGPFLIGLGLMAIPFLLLALLIIIPVVILFLKVQDIGVVIGVLVIITVYLLMPWITDKLKQKIPMLSTYIWTMISLLIAVFMVYILFIASSNDSLELGLWISDGLIILIAIFFAAKGLIKIKKGNSNVKHKNLTR